MMFRLDDPVSDGSPVVHLRVVKGLVMGAGGQHKQVGAAAAAGDEIVSHRQPEKAVAVTLDDEDGKSAIAESIGCGPDRRDQRRKEPGNPGSAGCLAEGRESRAEHEPVSLNALENGGGDSSAQRKSEKRNRERWRELLKKVEGANCIVLKLAPIGPAGAEAVARVIEDEGSDAALCEVALDGKPLGHNFADAVTDEDGRPSLARRWSDIDGVEPILSTGNRVLRGDDTSALWAAARDTVQKAIPYLHQPAGTGKGGSEQESV